MPKAAIKEATDARAWLTAAEAASMRDWRVPTSVYGSTNYLISSVTGTSSNPWILPCTASNYCISTGTTAGTTSSITVTNDAFNYWAAQATQEQEVQAAAVWARIHGHHVEVRENEAQRRQRLAELEGARRRQQEIARQGRHEAAIAQARAKRLLIENISKAQRKQLRELGYFEVQVNGRTYRIKWGSHGNVFLVQGGREIRSFCIQPPDTPDGDSMLAQKLLLEANEAMFLQIANARDLVRA